MRAVLRASFVRARERAFFFASRDHSALSCVALYTARRGDFRLIILYAIIEDPGAVTVHYSPLRVTREHRDRRWYERLTRSHAQMCRANARVRGE